MDETRLLILGSQVLFGFLFQSVVQNGFDSLSSVSKNLVCAALAMLLLWHFYPTWLRMHRA